MSTFQRVSGSTEALEAGPPWSVGENEVRGLFGEEDWEVEKIDEIDVMRDELYKDSRERWRSAGLDELRE
eukprot:CAMPEP_0182521910 /NCGR_PEP_ID=MMETSP1321-20130603/46363_1 /TAXON_ID=91990 /ORGANISM="Bolidomonas sp., Strain RCC1657" /LENGTH=69 /DNA_ID=CAMNT_0024729947 /DNA_START=779 /DNA_END=985 /DNA_ORIENTATION=-